MNKSLPIAFQDEIVINRYFQNDLLPLFVSSTTSVIFVNAEARTVDLIAFSKHTYLSSRPLKASSSSSSFLFVFTSKGD